jgi:hypothetical protein
MWSRIVSSDRSVEPMGSANKALVSNTLYITHVQTVALFIIYNFWIHNELSLEIKSLSNHKNLIGHLHDTTIILKY